MILIIKIIAYIREITSTDYICQEKKEEEHSPAHKIAWMHQYEDWRTSLKQAKKG